jgi:circadian clock protein KaiC
MHTNAQENMLVRTGIAGLDDVLEGGFTSNRVYLIEGSPGAGKTTRATQFLLEGVRQGEPVMHVTLSETEEEIRAMADAHGWSLQGVTIRELVPSANVQPEQDYAMFHPSEVELAETAKRVLADAEELKPRRIVFDSLSELVLLAGNPLRFRRQILAFKHFFAGRDCTVLLLDDMVAPDRDMQVQSIVNGVILLEQTRPDYGVDRRRLNVLKFRGRKFRGGYHDYLIERGGLKVFPRLVAAEHRQLSTRETLQSGISELDKLMGGGIERGTSTLVVGAAGTGKSTIASQFCTAAAERGQTAAIFCFDETIATLVERSEGLGISIRRHIDAGRILVRQIDPAELSPGEFVHSISRAVNENQCSIIVIDSLNGYLNAMPGERYLTIQLHELLMYLAEKGVASMLIGAHQGLIGAQMNTPVDASYLADTVILLRYFEALGEVRQAISIVKRRAGEHERTIREFSMKGGRICVGEPLREFRGVLTGTPVFDGSSFQPGVTK